MFPTADQIAMALVTACRLTGDNPIAVVQGERGPRARARHVAFDALIEAFPDARKVGLAKCLGYSTPATAPSNLKIIFRKLKWWRDEWVDEVVGALVAEQYGEQAQ
jgi:hypothetical protein